MRIAMLADVYKPRISGVTNHISLTKRYLENAGHEVFVFTFGDEEYPDDEPNVIRSPGLHLVDTGYYLNVRYSLPAQKLLRTMDIVHVHHPFLSGRLAVRYCKPRSIPIVFTNHTRYDLYAQAYLPIIPDMLGEVFLQAYLPSFCRECDLVIAPSEGMRDVLLRFGVSTPIEVSPNGVELSPFQVSVDPIPRSELGFKEEDVLLIYTGRLGPEKNLPLLLRAFAGTSKAYDHLGLILVGDGPERENLEDRVRYMGIEEHVCFTGMVPYYELPRYLAAADIFTTASVTEVHPLSVIEAMAAGLPVLGVRSPGVADIVEEDRTGYLAQEEDIAIFTAKMVRMVTDQESRVRMSLRASQVASDYAIEHTVDILQDHYQRMLRAREGRKPSLHQRWVAFMDGLYR
jgi:glycosyltransferase involved in cell wall biosynthesis